MTSPVATDRILVHRILPAVVIKRVEDAVPTATAMQEAGLTVLEIPLRTDAAAKAIRAIATALPDMLVGAGTVAHPDQIDEVIDAGGQFAVAAGLNERVVNRARDRNFPFIPGVMTPSEIERAQELGCRVLKLFPASLLGGIAALDALSGPYLPLGIKVIPMGGVREDSLATYLAHPFVAAVGGTWLAPEKLIEAGNWESIRELTSRALRIANEVSQAP